MRHRRHGRKLGRTSAHRKALFRNQLTALFTHERITTTLAKAKELRPLAERMVTMARTGSLPARRRILTMISDKDVVRRLFDDIAPRFSDRPGGYTRIMRLGRRHGDGAELAMIEFVDYELKAKDDGGDKKSKGSFMDRAKGMFGGGSAADEAEPEEAVVEAAAVEEAAEEATEPEEKPKKRTRKKKEEPEAEAAAAEEAEKKPKKRTRKKKEEPEVEAAAADEAEEKPKKAASKKKEKEEKEEEKADDAE